MNCEGFVIGGKIGSGTFAKVYQMVSKLGGPSLACKIIDKKLLKKDFQDKFLNRELKIMSSIRHTNIIQLYRFYASGSKVYIVMELAENGDMLEYIKKFGPVREARANAWFRQLLSAFQYLHCRDIAHRDLKCENILLDEQYNIKLADFGFARFCSNERGCRELSRTYCGSAAYAAPEVVATLPYNPKFADIWALGVVLYIITNGVMPFPGESLPKILDKQVTKSWQFEKNLRRRLSFQLKQLIRLILEPDIVKRLSLQGIARHPWLHESAGAGDVARSL